MPSPLPPPAAAGLADKLRHLPLAAQLAFGRFQATHSAPDLDLVLCSILEDLMPHPKDQPIASFAGDTRLIEDLGFDSLSLAETIFLMEELFAVSISNEEILPVRTLDDLRQFVLRKTAVRTVR